jgi:hypothetical protein
MRADDLIIYALCLHIDIITFSATKKKMKQKIILNSAAVERASQCI